MKQSRFQEALDFIFDLIINPTEECVEWTGSPYPTTAVNGKPMRLNRIAVELKLGRLIKPGHEAAHLCGLNTCINPQHIYEATHQQNMQDRFKHKTSKRHLPGHAGQFKGVYWYPSSEKYVAKYSDPNGKVRHIGYYDDPVLAATAYDAAIKLTFGPKVDYYLNFPANKSRSKAA